MTRGRPRNDELNQTTPEYICTAGALFTRL